MLAETLEEKLAAEKTLAGVVEANNKTRATYEPLIASPEERAIYNEWVQTWEAYQKGTEEVMALSRKAAGQISPRGSRTECEDRQQDIAHGRRNLSRRISITTTGAPTRRPRMRPKATARPS